jgi:hypothetical protein
MPCHTGDQHTAQPCPGDVASHVAAQQPGQGWPGAAGAGLPHRHMHPAAGRAHQAVAQGLQVRATLSMHKNVMTCTGLRSYGSERRVDCTAGSC